MVFRKSAKALVATPFCSIVAIVGSLVGNLLLSGCETTHTTTMEVRTQPDNPAILQSPGRPVRVCIDRVDVCWQKSNGGGPAGGFGSWTYTVNGQTVNAQYSAANSNDVRARSDQWAEYVRGEMRSQLQNRAARSGIKIDMVSRDEIGRVLEEKDAVKAGIVGRDRATDNLKVLPIDLLLVGTIEVKSTVEDEIQNPSIWRQIGGNAASHLWFVGGAVGSSLNRPTREVRRTLTLGGSLRAVDACTEHVFASESIARQVTHNPSCFGDESELDMPPLDSEIRVALDDCITRFLDHMLPGQKTVTVTYKVQNDDQGRAAAARLATDPKSAVAAFESAAASSPTSAKKQHAAGVACEKAGDYAKARSYYQRAVDLTDANDEEHNEYSRDLERARHLADRGGTVAMK